MNDSRGRVEEMGVNVTPGKAWKKHAIVDGGDWAAVYLMPV